MSKISRQKHDAFEIVRKLQEAGYEAYFAGGCVRDVLLGRKPKDYDVATNARPDEVEALFPKTIAVGKAFGVIAVMNGKTLTEVATFRKDFGMFDGRRPETVKFCAAKEDAFRRDFTVNGMFFDPIADKLLDYVDGKKDLEAGIIRAIGNPRERFEEDHLRMLRAVRFAHTLGFTIEPETETAIREMAGRISKISAERIEQEFSRLLTESIKPGDAIRHLVKLGMMKHIIPEVIPMIGQQQPPQYHPEGDVFEHTVLMLNLMKDQDPSLFTSKKPAYTLRELVYTLLLHDVGKPPTASIGLGTDGKPRIRFDGHDVVGAEMAEVILQRLRLPKKEIQRMVEAIRGHMRFKEVQKMRDSKVRKLIGKDTFDLELELHRLDCLSSHRKLDNYNFLLNYRKKLADEPILPEPWLSGHDLIEMGFSKGKRIGQILKEAYDAQIENRFKTRGELLEWIRTSYQPEESGNPTAET